MHVYMYRSISSALPSSMTNFVILNPFCSSWNQRWPSTSACCMARIPRLRRLFVWRLIANPSEKRPVQRLIWLNFQKYRRTQYCSNQINVWFFLMAPAWIFNKIECFSQYNRALKCNGAASLRAGLCFSPLGLAIYLHPNSLLNPRIQRVIWQALVGGLPLLMTMN
jgi:hypothetical protein